MLQGNASDYEGRVAKTKLKLWRIYAITMLRIEGMSAFWYKIRKELLPCFDKVELFTSFDQKTWH